MTGGIVCRVVQRHVARVRVTDRNDAALVIQFTVVVDEEFEVPEGEGHVAVERQAVDVERDVGFFVELRRNVDVKIPVGPHAGLVFRVHRSHTDEQGRHEQNQ